MNSMRVLGILKNVRMVYNVNQTHLVRDVENISVQQKQRVIAIRAVVNGKGSLTVSLKLVVLQTQRVHVVLVVNVQ